MELSQTGGKGRFVWWRMWEGPWGRAGMIRAAKTLPWGKKSLLGAWKRSLDAAGRVLPLVSCALEEQEELPKGPALPGQPHSQHRDSPDLRKQQEGPGAGFGLQVGCAPSGMCRGTRGGIPAPSSSSSSASWVTLDLSLLLPVPPRPWVLDFPAL